MNYKCKKCGGDIRSVPLGDRASDSWLAAALELHQGQCDGQLRTDVPNA